MRGIDVSHHQGKIDWSRVRRGGYEFAFIKCTQGTSFKDSRYKENKEAIRKNGLLFGAYHFAGNQSGSIAIPADPIKEAEHFLKNVGDLLPGEIVVLDYETHQLKDPASWCETWLKRVEENVGFKPMLYTYHDFLKRYDWKKVSMGNYGLWAARYGLNIGNNPHLLKPTSGSFPFWAVWQYTSNGSVDGIAGRCDLNTTDMDMQTLKKYGKPDNETGCTHKCPVHCKIYFK